MVFSSLTFLFVFLPTVLLLYYMADKKFKNIILLASSLFFYAWGEPTYVIMMLLSIVSNYTYGFLVSTKNSKINKIFLVVAVISNLTFLGVFKYANFIIENINNLINTNIDYLKITMPLGISFFTFQAMSYVIDVYRKDTKIQRNLFNLALYVSLFPQLVAGPIVRYQTVAEEIKERTHSLNKFAQGLNRFVVGLSKKVLLANALGMVTDNVFAINVLDLSLATAWIGIISYTLQIYFDFSGYSDMAIGLGQMFGFNFLENFNHPYISKSVSEFWRRWHISLGSWFRDYIYIPLGGNRVSTSKQYRNLFIVWFLTGMWHGANWTFIIWGLYFGMFIALEKTLLNKVLEKMPNILKHIYLLMIVIIGWVFFRSENINQAFDFISVMFNTNDTLYDSITIAYLIDYGWVIVIAIFLSVPVPKYIEDKLKKIKDGYTYFLFKGLFLSSLLLLVTLYLINSTYNPFLYFRF